MKEEEKKRILKQRKEIIDKLKKLVKQRGKAIRTLKKLKLIEFEKLVELSGTMDKIKKKIDSVDHWVRSNNELEKELIKELGGLRLTPGEREALEGED